MSDDLQPDTIGLVFYYGSNTLHARRSDENVVIEVGAYRFRMTPKEARVFRRNLSRYIREAETVTSTKKEPNA